MTSNPTIFAKAIEGEDDYDEQFGDLLDRHSVEDAYWELVITDIVDALARPAARSTTSRTASTASCRSEVAPALAHDTDGTIDRGPPLPRAGSTAPNLFVKIPATAEGVPAIRAMIGEGRSINITLIFSLERYGEVIEA